MKTVIGIDIGGSTTKIVGFRHENGKSTLIDPIFVRATDAITSVYGAFGKFTMQNGLELSDIDRVLMTGVGASFINKPIYSLNCKTVSEFESVGLGGLYLSGLDEAIVVSMGTGTALIHAKKVDGKTQTAYLGGTGVGGGTSYSYQAEKDLTAGFNIVYGENEFKIDPKGDLKKVLESVRSSQGNVEVDMSKCYSNMYTLIVYSHDGEDFVKIHFTNLDDGVKNDNPGTTDSSTTDSSTNNGGTTDSSSNNNNSNNDTGGNSGGSSGGNSGGNSSGSSTKPWPPPGGYDIV